MIPRRAVVCLGFSQLVCWGISYYLIGVFGELIAADLGWTLTVVYGGFTAALVVMGLTSPFIGRLIDARGGRRVMTAGSVLIAVSCALLAISHSVAVYYAAWLCMGVAMRMTLYEAAFAALARIGGAGARLAISQITLLGGLASTTLWPIGHALADAYGWRVALMVYAVIALATIPLHLAIPVRAIARRRRRVAAEWHTNRSRPPRVSASSPAVSTPSSRRSPISSTPACRPT